MAPGRSNRRESEIIARRDSPAAFCAWETIAFVKATVPQLFLVLCPANGSVRAEATVMNLFTLVTRLCLVLLIIPLTASALVMRENGPEPVFIQIKESLRQSDALDAELANLASFQQGASLTVVKRWAGRKYLELVAFPEAFTREQALAVIAQLQTLAAVEKVVTASAYNLEFRSADFAREYAPDQTIPDAARRGFDVERIGRAPLDIATAVLAPHVTNRIIVRWKDEYVWKAAQTGFLHNIAVMHATAGCRVLEEQKYSANTLIQVLDFDSSKSSVAAMLARYSASEWVDFVQPDFLYFSSRVPNDPAYQNGGQWNLQKISAETVWNSVRGDDSLKIAVGDTGANLSHPDFVTNDSGIHFNFVANNNNVFDDHGHGSNVASIIGAQGDNGRFMTGVAWDVGLMHLKVLNAQNQGTSSGVSAAITFAADNQAIAINLSLGTPPSSSWDKAMEGVVRDAGAKGMLVVAAAGNDGVDSDLAGYLVSPASIPTENMIAVGATDPSDNKPSFSNHGTYRVELGAPGVSIRGLRPTTGANDYSFFSGTSQAAPHVTGALLLGRNAFYWETALGLRDRVLMAVDDVPVLGPFFRTGGRLNLAKMLANRTTVRNLSTRGKVENGDRILIGGFYVGGGVPGPYLVNNPLKVVLRGLGPSLPPLSVARLSNPKIRLNNATGAPVGVPNDDWGTLDAERKSVLINNGLTPTDSREAAMVEELPPGAYTLFVESQDGQFGVGMFEIYAVDGTGGGASRLINVSTRCPVGTGDEVAIGGAILGDPNQANNPNVPDRRILAFGKGPSIPVSGAFMPGAVYSKTPIEDAPVKAVAAVLPNPYLELHGSGGLIAANDQWRTIDGSSTGLEDKLVASSFAPTNENESALWPTLRPGHYTAILRDGGNGNGIGLVELFEF